MVNSHRNTINYLKTSIESIRKERVLQGLTKANSEETEDESVEEQTHRYVCSHINLLLTLNVSINCVL